MKKLFFETVTESGNKSIRPATQFDIDNAAKLYSMGKCPHKVISYKEGWLNDFKYCYTCKESLGLWEYHEN